METSLDIWRLLAGVALFLFAMTQLEAALQSLGGRSVALFLKRRARNRVTAVLSGIATTAFLQSSSVVGLMVLAFTGAGLLTLPSALAIIFGSNLGTTFTGWIVATLGFKFEIFTLAYPAIAIGGAALLFGRGRWAEGGRALLGLGLLLLGLYYMKQSVAGIEQLIDIQNLAGLAPWQYLLFGVVVAAVIQSSSATMMMTMAALNAGIISLPNAAAIAIGADLGTTTTVLLGALKGSSEKKRAALGHVIFNAVTDIIAFALRVPLLGLIATLGLQDPLYSLVAFHSLFNLIGLCVFLPVTVPFANFLERLVPADDAREARYLSDVSPAVNEAALAAVERETSLLIARALHLARTAFDPVIAKPQGRLPVPHERGIEASTDRPFDELYRASKQLEGEIVEFATRLQGGGLEEQDSLRLTHLLTASRRAMRSAKAIKDVRHNLIDFASPASGAAQGYLKQFADSMHDYLNDLFALRDRDADALHFDDLAALLQQLHRRHDMIHETVFSDVRDRHVDETLVSTLLNVNRELMNCQFWLLMSLASYHLTEEQAADLEQIPAT
ncbi:MAG: Na/Pi cotransporter family protein [Gammaproteobacteria bacterium]